MANVFDQLDAPASVNVFDRLDAPRANIFDQQDLKVAPAEEEPLVPQDYGPDWAKQFLEPGEVMSDADQARLHTPSISAPESGILPTLGRAKEAILRATSPITGPTDAQKIEEGVPVKDSEGNTTYEYKPLANEIEKRGLIPALTAAGSAMVDLPSAIQLTGQGKRTTLTDIDEQRQKQLLQPDQNDSVAMQAWKAIHNSVLSASHAVVNPVFTLIPNSRILSGAFTVDMAKSALDQATVAENAATPQEKLQGYVGALISAGFGIGAGTHALKGDGTLSALGKEDSAKVVQNAPSEALNAALLDPKLSASMHPEVRGQIATELNDRQQKQTAAEGAAKLEQELQPALLRFPGDVQERIGKIIAKQGNNEPLTPNEQATLLQIRGYASSIAGEQTAAEFTAPIEPAATAAEVRKAPQPDTTPTAVASTTAETTQSPPVQGGRSKLFAQALEEAAPEAAKAVEETTPEPAPTEKESEQQVKGDYETAHKKALDMADSIAEQVAKGQSDTVKEAARDAAHKSAVTSIEKDPNNPQFNPDFMRKAAMEAAGKAKSREMQSLDTEEGATQHESVASEDLSPAQQVQQKESTQHVEDSLSKLSDREQEIINRTVKGDETLKAVAQDLGISHQRVQQIQAEALGKLKRAMQSRFGEDYTGGPGAMGPLEAAAMEGGKTTTSLKRAVVDAQRTVDGRDAIGIEDRAGSKQLISDAEDAMEKAESEGRNLGSEIIDRILNSKSDDLAVSRNDAAALLVERTRLRNARSDAGARIADKNSTEEERTQASSQFAQMDEQIDRADQASRKAGTAWSDFGRMYQQVLRDDYTVEAMKSRMVAARGDKELSAEKEAQENAKIKEIYEALKEKAKAYDDHLEKTRFDEAKAHFDKLVKDTFSEAKKAAKSGTSITDFLNDQAAKAKERIIARRGRLQVTVDPLNVSGLVDEAIIGASHLANGIKDFAKWSKAMVDDFGDRIKPYLQDLFDSSTQYHEANEKLFLKGKKPETVDEIKATVKKGEPLSQKAVYDLARAHVKAGVEGMENVMKAVTKDLQEAHPGITEREVRDAFTGYGKVAFPSKEADLTKLREYRRLGQLQSAIEDAMVKTAPKKSGMQRDQPTQAIREKMKELNEAMRANGIETTSPEQQLKTTNDARATSLRNQIADLDKRLRTGVKPGKKTPVPDSPEVESLRAQRDAMKEKLAEIEKGPSKSADEIALDRYKTAIKNRTQDIQDRLARNDYSKPVRNKVQLDTEAQKLKTDYDREKLKFDQGVEKERLNNRTKSQKFWDAFIGIERGMKLSSDVVLGKLTSAAVLREFVLTPAYEATGGLISKVLPGLAARAPIEGGFSINALAKAKAAFFTSGMKDAWKNLKMEHSDLEASNSERRDLAPPVWYEYMGFLHSAMKATVKRSAFTHAMEKQIEFGIRTGEDINNPEVMKKYSQRAYLEAKKSVFQQDNVVSTGWSAALNALKNNKKYPNLGPALARVGNFFAPVVRVPTNIVGEVATGIHGPYTGAARAGYAYLKGIDSLPHEQADAIMSQLKRGLVGNAILLTGYYGYKSIGGFNQRDDKRPASDVQPETYKVGSVTLPRFTGHSQAGVLLDVGATLHRVQDQKGFASGARAATQGVVSQLPLIPVVTNASEAMGSDQALSKYINGMITSTVVPGLSSHIAKVIDTPGYFPKNAFDKANPRQPKTALDAVKVGIPGLRQQVPRPKPHRR